MAEQSHTLGPWEAIRVGDLLAIMPDPMRGRADTFLGVAIIQEHDGERSPRRVDANASLIAAAPELLEADEEGAAALIAMIERYERVDAPAEDRALIERASKAYAALRAASRKATGGSV
ncbi:hypothetical protein [Brevundimonas sp. GCM10030266]|uniref:hypothetical protein n=1 Tax=Brevundimonas sp. GCM10030266 TaxID=3273386 RepID=UPI00360ED85C